MAPVQAPAAQPAYAASVDAQTPPPPAPTPDKSVATRPQLQRVLQVLVEAEGNIAVAAETLGTPAHPMPYADIIAVLSDDPATVQRALRVFTLLDVQKQHYIASVSMRTALADMEPKDLANTYNALTERLLELTEPPKNQANGGDAWTFIFNNLPREAATTARAMSQMTPEKLLEMRRLAEARVINPLSDEDL